MTMPDVPHHDETPGESSPTPELGPMTDEIITLPRSGASLTLTRPSDMDVLLERVVNDPEQNLPYWSEIWPSGIALADTILSEPARVYNRRVLELGAGLGTTAIAALQAGAQLTVTDYAADAVTLCRENCVRNTGREPNAAFTMNWRRPDWETLEEHRERYAVILAADVVYERRDIEPLLDLLPRLLARDGLVWLAEPGRGPAARFLNIARLSGWEIDSTTHDGPWPDSADAGVSVGLHVMRR